MRDAATTAEPIAETMSPPSPGDRTVNPACPCARCKTREGHVVNGKFRRTCGRRFGYDGHLCLSCYKTSVEHGYRPLECARCGTRGGKVHRDCSVPVRYEGSRFGRPGEFFCSDCSSELFAAGKPPRRPPGYAPTGRNTVPAGRDPTPAQIAASVAAIRKKMGMVPVSAWEDSPRVAGRGVVPRGRKAVGS